MGVINSIKKVGRTLDPYYHAPNPYGGEVDAQKSAMDQAVEARRQRAQELAGYEKKFEQGGYNQQNADNYYQQADAPIEQGYQDASQSAAASYARRGLNNSGVAQAAQQQAVQQRVMKQRQARMAAVQAATQDQRANLSGSFGAAQAAYQGANADVGDSMKRYQMSQDMYNHARSEEADNKKGIWGTAGTVIGGGLGFLAGGPVGAAAGAGLGKSLAGGALGPGRGGEMVPQQDLQAELGNGMFKNGYELTPEEKAYILRQMGR